MVELRLRPTAAGPLERRHDRRDHGRHTELEEGAGGVPRAVGHPERTQTGRRQTALRPRHGPRKKTVADLRQSWGRNRVAEQLEMTVNI